MNEWRTGKRHITHGNCCASLLGGSGYTKQQSAQAPLCCFV